MLNDIDFFSCDAQQSASIADAKQVFGENVPYIVERRLDGKVVIFNEHFIRTVREALTTGCMAKMNAMETQLLVKFIEYQNGTSYRDITRTDGDIVKALDEWLMTDIYCEPHPVVNACFDAAAHTWNECTK